MARCNVRSGVYQCELDAGHTSDDHKVFNPVVGWITWRVGARQELGANMAKVRAVLRAFLLAPVTMSTLQPVFDLAAELNPDLPVFDLATELNPDLATKEGRSDGDKKGAWQGQAVDVRTGGGRPVDIGPDQQGGGASVQGGADEPDPGVSANLRRSTEGS